MLRTTKLKANSFIISPHDHRGVKQIFLDKDVLVHYHCWVNDRYKYRENMKKIEDLADFYN